jgi:hypothetical protein
MSLTMTCDDTQVDYSPGTLLVNVTDGPPYATVSFSIDGGAVVQQAELDVNGIATSVPIPVDASVGSHTLTATV